MGSLRNHRTQPRRSRGPVQPHRARATQPARRRAAGSRRVRRALHRGPHASAAAEPDDDAYRASTVALNHGQILLSSAQYLALEHQLGAAAAGGGPGGGGAVQQWDHLANALWISEKNPGYPFLAVPFECLGALRLTPLFSGALGCVGLWFGARRWLGRRGGAFAMVLYCSSGAAPAFAWRATMETFTAWSSAPARRATGVGLCRFARGRGTAGWVVRAGQAP